MKPDDSWVGQTRQTLLMQAKNTLPTSPEHKSLKKIRSFTYFIPAISFKWMRAPAFATIAIILALFGGSLYSVSAAENSLPGDFLYSVKLATEQARLALTSKPQDKVKLKTEFTERRVQEMKQVIAAPGADRKAKVTQATEVLKRDLNTIKQQLDDVKANSSPEEVKEAVKIVDEKTANVVKDLEESKEQLSPDEQVKISEAQMAATDTSLKAVEVLVETHIEASDIVTEEEVAGALKTHTDKVKESLSKSVGSAGIDVAATNTAPVSSTSTENILDETATSTVMEVISKANEAEKSFQEADLLVAERKLDEAVVKVKQGTQQALAAQKGAGEVKTQEIIAKDNQTQTAGTATDTTAVEDQSQAEPASSTQQTTTDKSQTETNQPTQNADETQ